SLLLAEVGRKLVETADRYARTDQEAAAEMRRKLDQDRPVPQPAGARPPAEARGLPGGPTAPRRVGTGHIAKRDRTPRWSTCISPPHPDRSVRRCRSTGPSCGGWWTRSAATLRSCAISTPSCSGSRSMG